MILLPNTPATQAFLDLFWAAIQRQGAAEKPARKPRKAAA